VAVGSTTLNIVDGCSGRPVRPLARDVIYCTISFSSARGGTRDGLAEIWTSATSRVDRGHARILDMLYT